MRSVRALLSVALVGLLGMGCKSKCHAVDMEVHPNEAKYAWTQCSDGHERTIVCTRSEGPFECACQVDGAPAKQTFRVPMPDGAYHSHMITAKGAAELCQWDDVELTRF